MYYVPRGGTRGGADQFKWDDVKSDKDRECYLGHSLMAPVGRWQQGKDLQWFNKDREGGQQQFQNEMEAVKHAEREALMTALGQKVPKVPRKQPKPDLRQSPEPQQSRKSGSKAKNVPMLKSGLSLERTTALLRAESTSKSKKKKKIKEKKKKSKNKKTKKRKQESSESSSSTDSDSSDYDSASDDVDESSRRHKRPNKQLSLKHQRSGTMSHYEDERTTFSYKRNLKHQSHSRSHSRQENDRNITKKSSDCYDKRESRDSISKNEDRLSRSKVKDYLDESTHDQFIGKDCRVDSANSRSNKYPSRNDSSDDDQGPRRTARSLNKNKSYKVSNVKIENRYRGKSPEGYDQRRSGTPEHSRRRGAKNEEYSGDKTYKKYRQSGDEGRDGRQHRTSQAESRHREYYK